MTVAVRVAHTADLEPSELETAHRLLLEVFDDLEPEDWQHCLGGLHALAHDGTELVGHAALVQRRLVHGERVLRCGYVEGVAVRADHRRQGVGGALMSPLERAVDRAYDVGVLASEDDALPFYTARGWRLWTGRAQALTLDGVVHTPDEEDCLFTWGPPLDPAQPLTCGYREGELW